MYLLRKSESKQTYAVQTHLKGPPLYFLALDIMDFFFHPLPSYETSLVPVPGCSLLISVLTFTLDPELVFSFQKTLYLQVSEFSLENFQYVCIALAIATLNSYCQVPSKCRICTMSLQRKQFSYNILSQYLNIFFSCGSTLTNKNDIYCLSSTGFMALARMFYALYH